MKTTVLASWKDFSAKFLKKYREMKPARRRQLIFRGHADANWKLRTTLDRVLGPVGSAMREQILTRLIGHFRHLAHSIDPDLDLNNDLEWELLGRHHGLPTTVLDFTASPYVAAYFAFAERQPAATHVSIWKLDRQVFEDRAIPQLAILDDDRDIRFNPRAQEQRGLFLQIKDNAVPAEDLVGDYLERFDLPVAERTIVLTELEEMTISARNLFRDLDAAARTAACRVLDLNEV